MKSYYIFILIFFLFPKNLLADGPFLYSLPFDQRIYSEETILESTKEKGINYPDFEKYLTNDKVELGKKVALISSLEIYFVLNSSKKSYFVDYKEKLKKTFEKNNSINKRFLIALMNDYETESPNIEVYKKFVDENPQSRTMGTVLVFAFNYDLLWNKDKRNYEYLSDFKENYEDKYFENFDNLKNDAPEDLKENIQEIVFLGSNCGYDLACLSPKNMDPYGFVYGLSEGVLNKLSGAVPIPAMAVKNNADEIGVLANNWIVAEFDIIKDLNIEYEQKKLLMYFISNEMYFYVNNYGTGDYYTLLGKSKNVISKINFEKQVGKTVKKEQLLAATKAFTGLKNIYADISIMDGGMVTVDDLRNLFHYIYLNPKELNKIYSNFP